MGTYNVTVIIPTFNGEGFLAGTLEGVFNQTYQNYELLILDDGSTDCTAEVVKKFKDSRIRFIRHETNIGFIGNWTHGVKVARGQYLAILGQDDIYQPQFLQRRVEAFKNIPDLVAATGAFECREINNLNTSISRKPSEHDEILSGKALQSYALEYSGDWFNGATLYNANIVRELWPKVILAGTALDLSLHLHLSLCPGSRIFFTPHVDTILRVHPEQESQKNNLYLAECGAKFAHQFWHFEIAHQNKSIKKLFRKRIGSQINQYARMMCDRGQAREARQLFACELLIRPKAWRTWLRYLRTYLSNPKSGDG
jgi:glycosyltransferase involved in cell wall biosynthesis